jgi:hypothetical protein
VSSDSIIDILNMELDHHLPYWLNDKRAKLDESIDYKPKETSKAHQEALKLKLHYKHFGRYTDDEGRVTHINKDGRLVPFKGVEDKPLKDKSVRKVHTMVANAKKKFGVDKMEKRQQTEMGIKKPPIPMEGDEFRVPQRYIEEVDKPSKEKAAAMQVPEEERDINIEALKQAPDMLHGNLEIMKMFTGIKGTKLAMGDDETVLENIKNFFKGNILAVYKSVPEEIRKRSKLWYDGANRIAKEKSIMYNLPIQSVAGVYASLSPQMDWYSNVSLGDRILEIYMNGQNEELTSSHDQAHVDKVIDVVLNGELKKDGTRQGGSEICRALMPQLMNEDGTYKKLGELETPGQKALWIRLFDQIHTDPEERAHYRISPEGNYEEFMRKAPTTKQKKAGQEGDIRGTGWGTIGTISNAIKCLESKGDAKTISDALGSMHKVRCFYNNIVAPDSMHGDVTCDTHAVAVCFLRPLGGSTPEVAMCLGSSPKGGTMPAGMGSVRKSGNYGMAGLYGLFADAYREAAEEEGVLPREMQSITWEKIRGMFSFGFKHSKSKPKKEGETNTNPTKNAKPKADPQMDQIDQLWANYEAGKIDYADVVEKTFQIANKVDPDWMQGGKK